MTTPYQKLAERIRNEIPDLDHSVTRSLHAWERVCESSEEQDIYLDSVALNLHSFYSGSERLLKLIARHVDNNLPDSLMWHRDLLQQMASDLPNVRPAVISQSNLTSLDEFRRFRHLVRNVYAVNLRADKIESLPSELPTLWSRLRAEFLAFADFLEQLA